MSEKMLLSVLFYRNSACLSPFQSVSKNALDIGLGSEATGIIRIEPAVPPTPTVTIRVSP